MLKSMSSRIINGMKKHMVRYHRTVPYNYADRVRYEIDAQLFESHIIRSLREEQQELKRQVNDLLEENMIIKRELEKMKQQMQCK